MEIYYRCVLSFSGSPTNIRYKVNIYLSLLLPEHHRFFYLLLYHCIPSIFRCTQTRGSWIFPATLHDMIGFVCFILVPSSPPFRPFSLNSIDFMDPTGQPFYNPCEVTISRAIHTVLPTYVNHNINKSFSQTYISYSRIFDSHLRKASYLLNKWKPTATPQRRLMSPPIQSQPQRVAHLPKRRLPSSRTAS